MWLSWRLAWLLLRFPSQRNVKHCQNETEHFAIDILGVFCDFPRLHTAAVGVGACRRHRLVAWGSFDAIVILDARLGVASERISHGSVCCRAWESGWDNVYSLLLQQLSLRHPAVAGEHEFDQCWVCWLSLTLIAHKCSARASTKWPQK